MSGKQKGNWMLATNYVNSNTDSSYRKREAAPNREQTPPRQLTQDLTGHRDGRPAQRERQTAERHRVRLASPPLSKQTEEAEAASWTRQMRPTAVVVCRSQQATRAKRRALREPLGSQKPREKSLVLKWCQAKSEQSFSTAESFSIYNWTEVSVARPAAAGREAGKP